MKNLAQDVDTAMHTATAAPAQDTWHNMPATLSNSWAIGGHAAYKKSVYDSLLIVSFKDLAPGSVSDGTVVWPAGSLPTGYQVASAQRVAAGSDMLKAAGGGYESPEFEFESDGSIQCYGFNAVSTRADLFTVIPLDF
jgi:hypothetical protein